MVNKRKIYTANVLKFSVKRLSLKSPKYGQYTY